MNTLRHRKIDGIQMRVAGRETIVHDTVHEKLHVLNGTAARILSMCDGTRSCEDIAREISAQAGAPYEVVLRDVRMVIEQFSQLELLSEGS